MFSKQLKKAQKSSKQSNFPIYKIILSVAILFLSSCNGSTLSPVPTIDANKELN